MAEQSFLEAIRDGLHEEMARDPAVYMLGEDVALGGPFGVTAGLAEYIEPLACAGVGAGVDGVFLEVHEEPKRAKSDAQNALALALLPALLDRLVRINEIVKS